MEKQIQSFTLTEKKQHGEMTALRLRSASPLPEILPGQFVQVRIEGSPKTYLRRPISIHDADYGRNEIRLLVQTVGEGTRTLVSKAVGEQINIIIPLGNSYTMPNQGDRVLMAGGGCGLAPYLFFGKMMKQNGIEPEFLVGARNKNLIPELSEYEELGKVNVITDDGSLGEKGLITQHSVLTNKMFDRIYACGTRPMMKAVARWAKQNGTWCEVSLENMMACGLGACLCCVEKTVDGNICTCKEGPVFNINKLLW